jgi:hypothetical protein
MFGLFFQKIFKTQTNEKVLCRYAICHGQFNGSGAISPIHHRDIGEWRTYLSASQCGQPTIGLVDL